jgi:hypothetical protein
MTRPFVSEAQRTKWKQLVDEGRVSQAQYDDRESRSQPALPPRASPRQRTVGPSRAPDAAKLGKGRY